jgi:hypothetical protein
VLAPNAKLRAMMVPQEPEVAAKAAIAAYDQGAQQLTQFLAADLNPGGRKIIECCLAGGSEDDYLALLPITVLEEDH